MVPFENNNKLKYLRAHTHRETERRAILSHKINGSHNKQIEKTENTSIMFVRSFVRSFVPKRKHSRFELARPDS